MVNSIKLSVLRGALWLIGCLFLFPVFGQLRVNSKLSPMQLVTQELLDSSSSLDIIDVRLVGNPLQVGSFYAETNHISIKEGILLSTGYAKSAIGPNMNGRSGRNLHGEGDADLTNLVNRKTYDASILEIDFIPRQNQIEFDFVFASEEYPEFVDRGVNDIFGLLLIDPESGKFKNLALIPNTNLTVNVDHVNQKQNSEYFILNGVWSNHDVSHWHNNLKTGEYAFNFQYDGFTKWLHAKTEVESGKQYTLKIAIADVGDALYDSAVMLKKNSLTSSPAEVKEPAVKQKEKTKEELVINVFGKEKIESKGDTLQLTLNINFEHDKAETTNKKDLESLDKIADILFANPKLNVTIEGHTDLKGSKKYNQKLSEKRSQFAQNYLLQSGVSSQQVKAIGYGASKPLVNGTSEEANSKNRRVVFVFYNSAN